MILVNSKWYCLVVSLCSFGIPVQVCEEVDKPPRHDVMIVPPPVQLAQQPLLMLVSQCWKDLHSGDLPPLHTLYVYITAADIETIMHYNLYRNDQRALDENRKPAACCECLVATKTVSHVHYMAGTNFELSRVT